MNESNDKFQNNDSNLLHSDENIFNFAEKIKRIMAQVSMTVRMDAQLKAENGHFPDLTLNEINQEINLARVSRR
ncbi:MAG: hypothetical protein IJ835_04105 [Muribaculaceae bacterium]|nr:hypothetical protein [Muribaculaceae bacterium]